MRALALSLLLWLVAVPGWGQASRNFDGSDDFISCGDIAAFDSVDNLTVAAWARLDDDDALITGIVSKDIDNTDRTFSLRKTAAEVLIFELRTTSAINTATCSSAFTIGQWFHAAGTWNRADSTRVRVYLNGVECGTEAGSDHAAQNSTGAVEVGIRRGAEWDGQVAHVSIEARTWSAAEIADAARGSLLTAQRAAGGTGGYLPLWDPEATPATYRGQGLFAGACTASAHPAVSSDGPAVFIPGGGGQ